MSGEGAREACRDRVPALESLRGSCTLSRSTLSSTTHSSRRLLTTEWEGEGWIRGWDGEVKMAG